MTDFELVGREDILSACYSSSESLNVLLCSVSKLAVGGTDSETDGCNVRNA